MNCALLRHLDTHRSMVPDVIHPRKKTEPADLLTEPLLTVYQYSRITGTARLANVVSIYKMGCREDPRNYRPASLTSVPGKVRKQVILSAIT